MSLKDKNCPIIPPWISSNVYKDKNGKYRAYISNELSHEYLLLEDLSAEIWAMILAEKSEEEIASFTQKNDIKNEINDFFQELVSIGILQPSETSSLSINHSFHCTKNDEIETIKFQDEMRNWLISNGYMQRLFLELTYNCNLKCMHCFNDKTDFYSYIKFKDIKKTIDEAYELGVFNITLSGGECTLDKDFLKIVKYIRKKRISLDIFTNGQTLYDNETLFNKLLETYPFQISLSLYSMDENIHDKITGIKGSQRKTIEIIKKLRNKNINVEIKCFLIDLNANSYPEIEKFANEIGVGLTVSCNFVNNPTRENSYVQTTAQQIKEIYSDSNSLLSKYSAQNINTEDFKSRKICFGGHTGVCVAPNLDVFLCPTLKVHLGNLKDISLKKLWKDTNKKSTLNSIKELKIKDLKDCFKEEYCKYCSYCPGITFIDNQFLQKYENFCKTAKIKMEIAKNNSKF